METKFYRCRICGNVIFKITDSGVLPHCCGREMDELIPKTKDEFFEKHVPVVAWLDDCTLQVMVGSTEHPMSPEHYIEWIYVETKEGGFFRKLSPSLKPCVKFTCKCTPVAVYAYCNIHGLWKTDVVDAKSCESKHC